MPTADANKFTLYRFCQHDDSSTPFCTSLSSPFSQIITHIKVNSHEAGQILTETNEGTSNDWTQEWDRHSRDHSGCWCDHELSFAQGQGYSVSPGDLHTLCRMWISLFSSTVQTHFIFSSLDLHARMLSYYTTKKTRQGSQIIFHSECSWQYDAGLVASRILEPRRSFGGYRCRNSQQGCNSPTATTTSGSKRWRRRWTRPWEEMS